MENNYGTISTTIDSIDKARVISKIILDKGLSKCIQISTVNSIYYWKSEINDAVEYRIEIKSIDKSSIVSEIVNVVKKNHTYDIPEIVFTPIRVLSKEYKSWLDGSN